MKKLLYVSYLICLNISFFTISQESELSLQLVLESVGVVMSSPVVDEIDLRCTEILTSESDTDEEQLRIKCAKRKAAMADCLEKRCKQKCYTEKILREKMDMIFNEVRYKLLKLKEESSRKKYTVDEVALRRQQEIWGKYQMEYVNAEENLEQGRLIVCRIVGCADKICHARLCLDTFKTHVLLHHVLHKPYVCVRCSNIFALPSQAEKRHQGHRYGIIKRNYHIKDFR